MDGHHIGMPIVAFIWSILLVNMNRSGIALAWWSAFIGQCINAPRSKSRPPTLVYLSMVNILHYEPGLHQPRPHVPCSIGQHAAWSTCGLHYMDIDPGTCQPECMLTAGHVDRETCWLQDIWPWHMLTAVHVNWGTCGPDTYQPSYMLTVTPEYMSTKYMVLTTVNVDRGTCPPPCMLTAVHVTAIDGYTIWYGWATILIPYYMGEPQYAYPMKHRWANISQYPIIWFGWSINVLIQ